METVDTSKLTGKSQATPIDLEFAGALEGTLTEWISQNDEEAYREL